MNTYKVMTQNNLTDEITITNKAFSLENAQNQMFAIVGRLLIDEGNDRSGKYSENGQTLSISLEKLNPVGWGQINSWVISLIKQQRGAK